MSVQTVLPFLIFHLLPTDFSLVFIYGLAGSSLVSFVHLSALSFLKDLSPVHLVDIGKLWIQQPALFHHQQDQGAL